MLQRVALVTGSARGIGQAIAQHLEQTGYTVITTSRSSKTVSAHANMVQADLTQPQAVKKLFQHIQKKYKKLDLLVNTVGDLGPYKSFTKLTLTDWQTVISSNIYTAALCIQTAIPLLKKSSAGRIVNFSCAEAEHNLPRKFTVPYYIAKAGIITLTRSWAQELTQTKITVNSLAPGMMENSKVIPPSAKHKIVRFADITHAVDFLIQPTSRAITGANLEITAGWRP